VERELVCISVYCISEILLLAEQVLKPFGVVIDTIESIIEELVDNRFMAERERREYFRFIFTVCTRPVYNYTINAGVVQFAGEDI
jgi:hypothetical protein